MKQEIYFGTEIKCIIYIYCTEGNIMFEKIIPSKIIFLLRSNTSVNNKFVTARNVRIFVLLLTIMCQALP